VNLILAGPCGIGKSTVAKSLANRIKIFHLDFDELRAINPKNGFLPISVGSFNLHKDLPPILDTIVENFIFDIGGDTLFRPSVDNNERLKQILWLKKTYSAQIVLLTGQKDILLKRFISIETRSENDFEELWKNWLDISEPCWRLCGDIFIDTSFLSIDDVVGKIEAILNRNIRSDE
jgi:hypothetical protein